MKAEIKSLIVSSPEFVQDGLIPIRFTCKGQSINPTLVIDKVPEGTCSMVVILEDPDAPNTTFIHWVLYDILPANSIEEKTAQGVSGVNSAGKLGYYPPCPPSGIHHYYFNVFALSRALNLRPGADKAAVEEAMRPCLLASGSLMGRFGDIASRAAKSESGDEAQAEADKKKVDKARANTLSRDSGVEF